MFYRDFAALPSHLNMIKPFSTKVWLAFGTSTLVLFIAYACFVCVTESDIHYGKKYKKGNAIIVMLSIVTCRGKQLTMIITKINGC